MCGQNGRFSPIEKQLYLYRMSALFYFMLSPGTELLRTHPPVSTLNVRNTAAETGGSAGNDVCFSTRN